MFKKLGILWVGIAALVLIGGFVALNIALSRGITVGGGGSTSTPKTSSSPAPAALPPAVNAVKYNGAAYVADFSSSTRPAGFSTGDMQKTPIGDHPYLGLFKEPGVNFAVENLPPHRYVHVTFDLLLAKSWNGCSPRYGHDVWLAHVIGGQKLIETSFCNCGFFGNANNEQNYPDVYPLPPNAVPHEAWAGSLENQTMGFAQSWGTYTADTSCVYRMDWTFPHTGPALQLKFTSRQQKKHDKQFAFLNFKIEPVQSSKVMTTDELEQAWSALQGEDAVTANAAVWKLIATGEQGTKFLAGKLGQPPATADPYFYSRIRHILEVTHTDLANRLIETLPKEQPVTPP